MDQTNKLILSVTVQKLPFLAIETNDGKCYSADLSGFASVYCFPTSQAEWEDVGVSTGGYALTWSCGFEVHVDQVIAEANETESLRGQALGH